jgi:hypothetical protein
MKHQSPREFGYQIAVAIMAVAGTICLSFIPGAGILLLCAAFLVGFFGFAVSRRIPRIPGTGIWIGVDLAFGNSRHLFDQPENWDEHSAAWISARDSVRRVPVV